MAIKVTSLQFNSTLDNSGYSDFLTGNIGDPIRIKINFYVESTNVATTDNEVIFNPTNINTLDTTNLIYCENTEFVSKLKVGDVIEVVGMGVGYEGTYTVTELLDSQTFRVDDTFANATKTSGAIVNTTNYKGVKYYFNFVEGGNDFTSLTDPNEIQLFTANNVDYTVLDVYDLVKTGQKTWQFEDETVTIETLGSVDSKIYYELIHDTIISPLHLANQTNDTENGIRPSYFKGGSTLNYIYKLDLGRNLLDVNNFETVEGVVVGNVGWFNENFNGLQANYTLDSINYSNTISALDLNVNTEVVISILCNNTSFTSGTIINFGFIYLPENESDYQENNRYLSDNFCFDYKKIPSNNTPYNGANFGLGSQVIKNVKSTVISTSNIEVTANIQLGTDYKNIISESDFKNYLLFVSVEDATLPQAEKDRVNIL